MQRLVRIPLNVIFMYIYKHKRNYECIAARQVAPFERKLGVSMCAVRGSKECEEVSSERKYAMRACMQCLVRIPLDMGTCFICVLTLFYMCPHNAIYVSSYCYVYVLIQLYVSSYRYICFLILLYMRPHAALCALILLYMCPHTGMYVRLTSACGACQHFASAPRRPRLCLWHACSVLAALLGNDGSPGPHTTLSHTHTLTHSPTPHSLTALMTE